ncbi:MAG: hypothetical protein WEA58_10665 [Balneolaceae bacterium]
MILLLRKISSFLLIFWRQVRIRLSNPFRWVPQRVVMIFLATGFLSLGFISMAIAQTEDTTRVDREVRERMNRQAPNMRTPINMDIPESAMNRYRVNDPDGNYTFHLRLRDESVEDFLFKEGSYSRYGPEWERQINEDLMKIVDEIFEETHPLLGIVNRIAPFLGIGFFTQQPEFRPPPRIEYENKVDVD